MDELLDLVNESDEVIGRYGGVPPSDIQN